VRRNKYRDEENDEGRTNIMTDPRVFRGSNVVNKLMSSSLKDKQRISKDTGRASDRRRVPYAGMVRGSTPPPVAGRRHTDIQTDEYLEVLTDRMAETDMSTQTPAAMDRPASPLFVRAKTGIDVDTQIETGDLFDFDLEVEPLLEVLVGRTLHVAMLEVMQEEELEAIRLQQEEFEAVRNIELAEVQRLEAAARRTAQEKQRRLEQEQRRVEEQRQLESKVAARAFAEQYLGALHEDVFAALEQDGQFVDPLRRELQDIFMPSLLQSVRRQYSAYVAARAEFAELLEAANAAAVEEGLEALRLRKEREEEEALELLRAEEERLQAEAERKAAEATQGEAEEDAQLEDA
jgi:hypothetical protein